MQMKKPTLDSILSDFQKTISQLDDLVQRNNVSVVKNNDAILKLQEDNDTLNAETKGAENVLKNLNKLISTDTE